MKLKACFSFLTLAIFKFLTFDRYEFVKIVFIESF